MLKRTTAFLLLLSSFLTIIPSADGIAAEINPSAAIKGSSIVTPASSFYYYWKVKSSSFYSTISKGSKQLFYVGDPATRNGEVDTLSYTVSYSNDVSGQVNVGSQAISIAVGFTIGKQESFGISKSSAPLNVGEYVKGYYTKKYSRYKVIQEEWAYDYGLEYSVGTTATAWADKAILPSITLEYYNSGRSGISSKNINDMPFKTEVYEYIDGSYIKVSEDIHE